MSLIELQPALYISEAETLKKVCAEISQEPKLAVDTESNSLYAYKERVCLIQLSTSRQDYLIDPFTVRDLSPLGEIFANPNIEKSFHAAEYDLMCLKRDYGFTFSNLFDTMIAARICGYKGVGLGSLLSTLLAVEVDKSQQRANWGVRPLPKVCLQYAQNDTHYLLQLRYELEAQLVAQGRLEEAHETFRDLETIQPVVHTFDPQGYWRIAIPNHMPLSTAAILRELYLMREQAAKQRNVPVFKVMTDKTLMSLAREAPKTREQLASINGIGASTIRRYGNQLLSAIQKGSASPEPEPPTPEPPIAPAVMELYTLLREWRKNRAQERGVESDVIISKEALWELAERSPSTIEEMQGIHGLGPWRMQTYAQEILDVITEYKV